MKYLRASQVRQVTKARHSINLKEYGDKVLYRFPFPNEDGIPPGGFDELNGYAVYGVEVPEDDDGHYSIQFLSNKACVSGMMACLPCPKSAEGKTFPIKVSFNGFCGGDAQVKYQRIWEGKLATVIACPCCGGDYRLETLDEALPIIDAILKTVPEYRKNGRHENAKIAEEMARRITAGYTDPLPAGLRQFAAR